MQGYLIETCGTALGVCALAVLVLWSARRLGVGRPSGPIELCGHLPLDARRAIFLVKVGEEVFIVGASEGGFTTLGGRARASPPRWGKSPRARCPPPAPRQARRSETCSPGPSGGGKRRDRGAAR